MIVLVAPFIIALLLGIATLIRVYRGGTTLNDHFVAAVVLGCLGVYPVLWWGAMATEVSGHLAEILAVALLVGALGIYALFHVLDAKPLPGGLAHALGILSQMSYAFSLWTGLLLVLWAPLVFLLGPTDSQVHFLWPAYWLIIPCALTLWGTVWTYMRHGRVRKVKLRMKGIEGKSVRIVHLSDIHASPIMPRRSVDQMVEAVNKLNPDLVCITGDMVMPFSEDDHDFLVEALGTIQSPVYCCPGNHDLPVLERLGEELAEVGVTWMVDDIHGVLVGKSPKRSASGAFARGGMEAGNASALVELMGVNFHWNQAQKHFDEALAVNPALTGANCRILLAHDPRLFAWVPDGRFDLVLSGHTHGGQVSTEMFGIPWSVLRLFGVHDQGLFRERGLWHYVHRGNWHTGLPPRMGVASEIVMFELVGAETA